MYKILNVSIAATVLATSAALTTGASANEITLTLKDQGVELVGSFAGFQNEAYIIEMPNGDDLHVPAKYVDCKGEDCLVIVTAEVASN